MRLAVTLAATIARFGFKTENIDFGTSLQLGYFELDGGVFEVWGADPGFIAVGVE